MSQTTFTPGPWKWHVDGRDNMGSGVLNAYIDGKNSRLAYVWDVDKPVGKANARLIAAAPDLLEACEALLVEAQLQDPFEDEDGAAVLETARAAIAKAKEDGG